MGENRFKSAAMESAQEKEKEELAIIEAEKAPQLETESKPVDEKPKKSKGKNSGKGGKTLMTVFGGTYLVNRGFAKQFPFMVYVTILLMILITNTYVAEEKSREITQTTKKLNDLQVEYVQLKSAIMESSKQSVLARKLKGTGIKETIEPLKRINIEEPEKAEE